MEVEYKWKKLTIGHLSAGFTPLPPHEAYNALQEIRKKRIVLSASIVVDESTPEEAPLHDFFEWNDAKAARLQREETARLIMRSIIIEVRSTDDSEPRASRALVSVMNTSNEAPEKTIYIPVTEALQNPDTRAEILHRALGELVKWRKKYENLQELAQVFRTVDEFVA